MALLEKLLPQTMKRLEFLVRFFVKYFLEGFLILLIPPMVLGVFAQVVLRYILRSPPFGTGEFSRYLFIWVSFVGSAYTFKLKGHATLELIYRYLPLRFLTYYKHLINFIIIFLLALFVYYGIVSCINVNGLLSPALEVNMVYVNAALPVSAFIMLCYQIYFTWKG